MKNTLSTLKNLLKKCSDAFFSLDPKKRTVFLLCICAVLLTLSVLIFSPSKPPSEVLDRSYADKVAIEKLPIQPPIPPKPWVLKGQEGLKIPKIQLGQKVKKGPKKNLIAIVIDDVGLGKSITKEAIKLPKEITLAFLPYGRDIQEKTKKALEKGHELWVHVPMEPLNESVDSGPHTLKVKDSAPEIMQNLEWNLAQFDGYVGINNHMGSKFTAQPNSMEIVMKTLKKKKLLFLDSRTTPQSYGYHQALKNGVRAIERDVFLDNVDDEEKILAQLKKLEEKARQNGQAVGIGHPRKKTFNALYKWMSSLNDKEFVVVPLSRLMP